MMVLGTDPHKDTHTVCALDASTAVVIDERCDSADADGFTSLLVWARGLDADRVWIIEDCRHVSGPWERFLMDNGEHVRRLAPHLMGASRKGSRRRGKSDPIDATAIARAAIREGIDTLPVARLAGIEDEIRLLVVHRERLVGERTRFINELRWQLHDLWPELKIPARRLVLPSWQKRVAARLARAPKSVRVRIARDLVRRVAELTRAIGELHDELAVLVARAAPQLLEEPGCGVLIAAKLVGHIGDITRFDNDAQLARLAGCAPIPVSSGRTDRHRLDRGGNRQLNHAVHMFAFARVKYDQRTGVYLLKQQTRGKTPKEATRSLKRHLIRHSFKLLHPAFQAPDRTVCLT